MSVFVHLIFEAFQTVVDEFQLEFVAVEALLGVEGKSPALLKHEHHAPGAAEVASGFFEMGAYVGHGAGGIVGGGFHQQRHAVRPVSLVQYLLKAVALSGPGSLVDSVLDFVFGHADGPRILYRSPQRRIGVGVGPASPNGDAQLAASLGEGSGIPGAPLGDGVLAVFKGSSHRLHIAECDPTDKGTVLLAEARSPMHHAMNPVIAAVVEVLESELQDLERRAVTAAEQAVHEESRPEDPKDTRGLEASYLAHGLARRAQDLQASIQTLRFLPEARAATEGPITAGMRFSLEDEDGATSQYIMLPCAGGRSVTVDEAVIQVVTPTSPLGRAILGKFLGDDVSVQHAGRHRTWEISDVGEPPD